MFDVEMVLLKSKIAEKQIELFPIVRQPHISLSTNINEIFMQICK